MEVTFAGSPDRVEARLVPERGYAFDAFRVAGFPRRPGLRLFRAFGLAAAAPVSCLRILARRQPDVVLGGGGYVGGPMVVAAWLRRIPAALTEADAHLGLANRLAAPFVQRLFLAYPPEHANGKARVVGRPVPPRSAMTQDDARRSLGLPTEGPVLLVAGGSQGARTLNETAVSAWGAAGPNVLHLSGEREYDELRARVTRDGYVLRPFVDDFGMALAAADIVVSRAGGSVWEIAAAGRPAILVPYPHATSDHQAKNAEYFERAGGARVVRDEDSRTLVPPAVAELLADPDLRARMSDAMRAAARPDAADKIADELVALAAARR